MDGRLAESQLRLAELEPVELEQFALGLGAEHSQDAPLVAAGLAGDGRRLGSGSGAEVAREAD